METPEYLKAETASIMDQLKEIDTLESRTARIQLHALEMDRRALHIALHATNHAVMELMEGINEELLNK